MKPWHNAQTSSSPRRQGLIHRLVLAARWIPVFAGMTMLLAYAPLAIAQDATSQAPATQEAAAPETPAAPANINNEKHLVDIEDCDFQIVLPGEPTTARRCNPDDPDECNRIITYTKVFDLDATVSFNVTCNPAEDGMYERYTGDVMKTTLEALIGKDSLTEYKTDFRETDDYKHAIIVGSGKVGDSDTIYSAQIWIGKSSVFTVEGQVIGFGGEGPDRMFAEVMASVVDKKTANAAKDGKKAATPAPAATDKPTDKKEGKKAAE